MNTTVVIVSYKSEHLIEKNIERFHEDTKIIIIDNSQDIVLKNFLEKKYKNIRVILNKNRGFGQAANLGASLVTTKYILFCSPDNFVQEDAIDSLENISQELCDDFSLLILSDKNNCPETKIKIKKIRGVFCFFTMKKFFFDLDGFDENFFLYYEDTDLIRRSLKSKLDIYQVPIKYSNFLGSHNKKFNHPIEVNRNWHYMWSKFYYEKKHRGYIYSFFYTLPYFIRSIIRLIINLNKSKKKEIYLARISGLYNSYTLKQPWYRPKINQK